MSDAAGNNWWKLGQTDTKFSGVNRWYTPCNFGGCASEFPVERDKNFKFGSVSCVGVWTCSLSLVNDEETYFHSNALYFACGYHSLSLWGESIELWGT